MLLATWKDFSFRVRPGQPDDREDLSHFFTQVSEDDRRFRFLSSAKKVSRSQIEELLAVDHDHSENFLAFDGEKLIGTAMLAADTDRERAEVAISLHADYKNRGIGWALLDHLARFAEARGIKQIESVESRENRQALAVQEEMGFVARPFPDDPTLVLVSRDLGPAGVSRS